MFKRDEVTQVLSRTNVHITKGTLCIRSDRNLHRDIGVLKYNNFFICLYILGIIILQFLFL